MRPGGQSWWRAPAVRLGLALHLVLALSAIAAALAMAMPRHGATVRAGDAPGTVLVLPDAGGAIAVPAQMPLTITASGAGAISLPAASFVNDFAPEGGPAAVRRFYRERDALAALIRQPGARLLVSGRALPLAVRPAQWRDMPRDVWLLLGQGAAIGLLGAWLLIGAPGPAARMFAASAGGVMLAAFSGAVFDARGLTGPGGLLQAAQALNFIGSNLCAAGLVALFLIVPKPLLRERTAWGLLALAALAGALAGLGLMPLSGFYAGLLAGVPAFVAIFALQWRRAAGDPAARAMLRWIGVGTFAGTTLLACGMAAPVLLDTPAYASDGMTIVPLFAIYGAIAFGVGGARVFALDRWSYRLVLGTLGLALLLLADAVLARLLRLDGPVALALALLAVGWGYLPLRALVWRLVTGRRAVSSEALFRQAALAAFAATAAARRDGWRDLIDRMFEPLELAALDAPVADVELRGDGAELVLPATADDGALALRFARRGARLFGREDVAVARELVALSAEAARARAEYARGVMEERARIARDLHDDVSGVLLTGLHRSDVGAVRGDLRQALGEIRTMVASLAGRSQPLSTVLADLRFETAARLEAAGIALDWPVEIDPAAADPELGYSHHKAVTSALREIVTNAIRHSGAATLAVQAREEAGVLRLDIADDGIGAANARAQAPRAPGLGGHGLANVRARLAEIGGECAIVPGERGFRITLSLPLPVADA